MGEADPGFQFGGGTWRAQNPNNGEAAAWSADAWIRH